MFKFSVCAFSYMPPFVLGGKKEGYQLPRGNLTFGGDEAVPTAPLDVTYGFRPGCLPKFHARNPFHRQLVSQRIVTELVRADHAFVAGAKGPALRILADHVVELAKRGDTQSRQRLANFLNDPLLVDKAFDEYPRRFRDMNGKYAMMTKLRNRRRIDMTAMYMIEYKNRDLSDSHRGEDYSVGPERFFLPPRVLESERGVSRPPHLQLAFDRWASNFKTEEFTDWWRMKHAKMRFWGYRNIPHPMDVDPLWSEKEEEEWQHEMVAAGMPNIDELDMENEEEPLPGEGGV